MDTRFTSKEQINKYFAGDKIECLICHKYFKVLGKHVLTHAINADGYKTKFGLPFSKGLAATDTREKMSKAMIRRIKEEDPSLMPIGSVSHKGQQTKNRFQPFTLNGSGERIAQYNVKEKTATYAEIEAYIVFLERERIRPIRIIGMENQYGLITNSTFCRTVRGKRKEFLELVMRYKDLQKNNPIASMKRKDLTRDDIRLEVERLRVIGFSSRKIAEDIGISKTTIQRILRGEGLWKQ